MSQPDKIVRNIMNTKNLYLRITVMTENDKWYSRYIGNDNVDTKLIYNRTIVNLGMNAPNRTDWDKSQSVMIHCRNHHVILRQMKRFIDNLYKGEMFSKDSNDKIILYGDVASKTSELIKLPYTDNNMILLRPHVITDSNNITYEGSLMCFNKPDNFVELYIDELEGLYYNLSKIDFFLYSQSLINNLNCNNEEEVAVSTPRKNLNW